jgi:YD repeat-containing protein
LRPPLFNLLYTYDAAGRQITKTDSYGTTNYTYDKAGRILKVDGPGKIDIYAYDGAGNRIAVNETYKSLQPSGFIDDATGNDVQYLLKKTDYTYSNAGKLIKLVERMYDNSDKEVLRKTVNYYYDANGNELSNTASWTHPHSIKLRQSTKGAVYADNMENETDSLIDRVNNTFDGFGRLIKVERISAGVRSESTFIYKTVNYYYDANGNELSNTASWTHPHSINLRQSTKGAVCADNMEIETDSLIDRVNNTFDGFGRLI